MEAAELELLLEAGRAAYTRYGGVVRCRAYDGRPLLPYDELPTLIKLGWAAAGNPNNPISIDDAAAS